MIFLDVSVQNVQAVAKGFCPRIWSEGQGIKYFIWNVSHVWYAESNCQLVKSYMFLMKIDSFARKTILPAGITRVKPISIEFVILANENTNINTNTNTNTNANTNTELLFKKVSTSMLVLPIQFNWKWVKP